MSAELASRFGPVVVFLAVLIGFTFSITVFGGGLDWGDGGDDALVEEACPPGDPPVLIPGPIKSPLRLAGFDDQSLLVVDYTDRQVLTFDSSSGALTPFIETDGKPLSVAVDATFKKNGKLKEATYFVGNDSARSLDVYLEKKDQLSLLGSYPVAPNGVQALDMAFDAEFNELYLVDGLAKEIKVVRPDGTWLRSFGAGLLFDPKGIAIDRATEKVYVSDYGNPFSFSPTAYIQVFNLTGSHIGTFSGKKRFSRPQGLSVQDGKLYLVDSVLSQVLELDAASGASLALHGCRGSGAQQLFLPMDVVAGGAGLNLYVADNRNMRITVLPLAQP